LDRLSEAYRRIRNTCRFLLGNLKDYDVERDAVPTENMPSLDRFALYRLNQVIERVRKAYENFEFHVVFHTLYNYCSVDLSSLYLDILKDRLYCERTDGRLRRSAQTALHHILSGLVRLMAPILGFTAEEVWARFDEREDRVTSVHWSSFPDPVPDVQLSEEERARWELMLSLRQDVSRKLEEARASKLIGSSLEARVIIETGDEVADAVSLTDDAEGFFIVSQLDVQRDSGSAAEEEQEAKLPGVHVTVQRSDGTKCPRCWRWTADVGSYEDYPDICARCASVLRGESD
jgi:isoleucyl-tRNA synthetase